MKTGIAAMKFLLNAGAGVTWENESRKKGGEKKDASFFIGRMSIKLNRKGVEDDGKKKEMDSDGFPIFIFLQGGVRMRNKKACTKFFELVAVLGLVLLGYSTYAAYTGKFTAGMTLPQLTFEGLTSAEDQGYLGVKGNTFTLADVSAKVILIDALSVL